MDTEGSTSCISVHHRDKVTSPQFPLSSQAPSPHPYRHNTGSFVPIPPFPTTCSLNSEDYSWPRSCHDSYRSRLHRSFLLHSKARDILWNWAWKLHRRRVLGGLVLVRRTRKAMPFSSMIQEMKGEIGAISRRGLLRSRSHSTGRVQRVEEPDEAAMRESSWAHVPPELLREVLAKVEAVEARWPGRGAVVACAGVCRGWRGAVKEIVRAPEASGRLTFPISLKQPGPRDAPLKCFIRRKRATQSYFLCIGVTDALADDGKFLLAARKYRRPSCTEYLISFDARDTPKGNGTYIGKLRSNFLGTKFTVYDAHPPCAGAVVSKGPSAHMIGSAQVSPMKPPPAGNYPVSHISYEVNVLGSRGPRNMNCVMDSIPVSAIKEGGTAPTQTEFPSSNSSSFASVPFFGSKSGRLDSSGAQLTTQNESKVALKNKSPRWHEQLQCWCLNFHGRVTVASVKNFQLVASDESAPTPSNQEEDDDVILQFGKIGKDLFTMDYRYPISAFQAFAICLSSFDTKIGCE